MRTESLRTLYTRIVVAALAALFAGACALWSVAVQHMVPDICHVATQPNHTGPVHCPARPHAP